MQKNDFFPVSNRAPQNGNLERRGIRKNSNFVFNVKHASNIQDQTRHVLLVVAYYKASTKKTRIKQNNEWTMDLSCTSVEFTNYFWRTLKGSTLWKLCRITKKEITWIPQRNTITERSWTATSTTNNAKCPRTNKDTRTPTWKNLTEQQMKRRCTSQKRQTLSRKKQRHRKKLKNTLNT